MPERTSPVATRRSVLLGGAGALGLTALGGGALSRAIASPGAGLATARGAYFNLGVASGDPLPDSVVLWTRLAPNPTAADGYAGMPDRTVPVQWELSKNESFTQVVQRGLVDAVRSSAHSVHVEPEGLEPGTEYFYRFRAAGQLSETGRTRTAPAPGAMSELTMCFASCSHFGEGYFTAYRRMAEDQPGLILHLGDYQYEYAGRPDAIRQIAGPETVTLANYRQRHGQYKTDLDLQLAHATAPWLVVWDDHETENNFADEIPERTSETPGEAFLARRKAAFKAYYEHMPLRSTSRPKGIDMQLYRRIRWGALANFHMLDTRQYRSDQACGDGTKIECEERLDPNRTITGADQEKWLIDGFNASQARWDVLGQQVFFARRDATAGDQKGYSMDAWDGYTASQDKIAAAMRDSQVRNGVVLTGDVHRHWAGEVKARYDGSAGDDVGVELVATSITSGRDGDDSTNESQLRENPHLKYFRNRRGYVRTKFTATELRADYRILPYVTREGAPAITDASFTVADGEPKLRSASPA